MVRSTYHSDAHDAHGEYKCDIDGLIQWLGERFADVDNSMHFLGNCLIEFADPDHAFVETYFGSSRLRIVYSRHFMNAASSPAFSRHVCVRSRVRQTSRSGSRT